MRATAATAWNKFGIDGERGLKPNFDLVTDALVEFGVIKPQGHRLTYGLVRVAESPFICTVNR